MSKLRLPRPANKAIVRKPGIFALHRPPKTSDIATNTRATANIVCLVPIHWINTNPVMETPKMAPLVEIA